MSVVLSISISAGRLPVTVLLTTWRLIALAQPCVADYSYQVNSTEVAFSNQSSLSNAHFFWDFGDGLSSYDSSPTHIFPGTGEYLVTLFAYDTVSKCSDYHEGWLALLDTSVGCEHWVRDSLFEYNGKDYLKLVDSGIACPFDSNLTRSFDCGPVANFGSSWINLTNWVSARFVSRLKFYFCDSLGCYRQYESYKSIPFHYSGAKNYCSCSANYEFAITQRTSSGARVSFRAMNRTAQEYKWVITGFGNPIYYYADTASHFYPYQWNDLHHVRLTTIDSSGCTDTIWRDFVVRDTSLVTGGVDQYQAAFLEPIAFPNPFSDQIVVDIRGVQGSTTARLYDSAGRLVAEVSGNQTMVLQTNFLPSGPYWLRCHAEDGQSSKTRLVVKLW